MGLFSKKADKTRTPDKGREATVAPQQPLDQRNELPVSFYVAPGDTLTGHLRGNANVLIEGKFEGEIEISGLLWVTEKAEFFGFATCQDAHVAGKAGGTVRAANVLDIAASAECKAELGYGRLWKDGAFEAPPTPEVETTDEAAPVGENP